MASFHLAIQFTAVYRHNRLDLVHGVREAQATPDGGRQDRLWPWSRMTAWRRRFRAIMQQADITGSHATPKGLRHGFGVAAISAGVPLNLVQTRLGHAQLTTTAIYYEQTVIMHSEAS